jgi:hypothetical protein
MTHIEEKKVTITTSTTEEQVDPPREHAENINLNVNTTTDKTVEVDETTDGTQPNVNINVSR